jgi:hypothetical protein
MEQNGRYFDNNQPNSPASSDPNSIPTVNQNSNPSPSVNISNPPFPKSILVVVILYILYVLYCINFYFSFAKLVFRPTNIFPTPPFEIGILILGLIQILVIIIIIIGLLKLKKWAYKLGVLWGILSAIALIGTAISGKASFESIPDIVAAILLKYNKDIFS